MKHFSEFRVKKSGYKTGSYYFDFFCFGTFIPSSFASEIPIAIACLLLVTLSPEPDFSFPSLNSFITFPTLSWAFSEYFLVAIFNLLTLELQLPLHTLWYASDILISHGKLYFQLLPCIKQ